MSVRRSYRPEVLEALEERVVMSGRVGTALALRATEGGAAVRVGPIAVRGTLNGAVLGPVGTLGDSYTDEYRGYLGQARGRARNWVEILNVTRGVDFGAFTLRSRGEPRNLGFAYDWARGGATSSEMVANQLPGLSAQVAQGTVRTAWVFIGGNDFLRVFEALQNGSVPIANATTTLQQTEARLEANFKRAVDTLLAASPNVRLVVSTLPDIANLPVIRLGAAVLPGLRPPLGLTSRLIETFNASVRTIAQGNSRIALVDLAASTGQLMNASGRTTFGGQTIDLNTPGDDYRHFFLSDFIHVGTVGQGLIADAFLNAVNTRFGQRVRPLSQVEIVRFAQRVQAPGGASIR